MHRDEFIKQQFWALRQEINDTKTRLYRLIGTGLLVIPSAQFAAKEFHIEVLMLALPILIMIVAMLYLSENHAMMRCGCYIREEIETHVEPSEDGKPFIGWEEWLESDHTIDPRTVDRYVNYCFYLLFFVYYLLSVILAIRHAMIDQDASVIGVLLGTYVAVGVWFLIFLIRTVRSTTSTGMFTRPSVFISQSRKSSAGAGL